MILLINFNQLHIHRYLFEGGSIVKSMESITLQISVKILKMQSSLIIKLIVRCVRTVQRSEYAASIVSGFPVFCEWSKRDLHREAGRTTTQNSLREMA